MFAHAPLAPRFSLFACVALATFVLVFGAAWIWSAIGGMYFYDREYPTRYAKMQMISRCDLGDRPILGDSVALAGLIPGRIGRDVVNLAIGASTPLEIYYMARPLLACARRPRRVILSFSFVHFMDDFQYWNQTALYGVLDFWELEEVRSKSRSLKDDYFYAKLGPADIDARLKNLLHAVRFPTYAAAPMLNARLILRKAENDRIVEEMNRTRGHYHYGMANGWPVANAFAIRYKAFAPDPVLNSYFEVLLDLFATHDIQVDFLGMPLNEATLKGVRAEVRDGFVSYLEELARRHPNFRLLGDPVPWLPSEYFGDSSHLNARGAALWSDRVAVILSATSATGSMRAHDNER